MEKYDLESWDEDKLGSYGINFIKAKMVEKWFYKNGGIELRERAIQARDIYTKLSILEPNYDEFLAVMRHIAIQEGLTLFQEKVGDVATFNNLDNDEIINYAYERRPNI